MSAPVPPPILEHAAAERRRVRTLAAWVALAALVAHLGFVPGEPGWVGTHRTLNYDDPQVVGLARGKSVAELLTGLTYYAYKPLYFLSLKIDVALAGVFGDGDPAGSGHVVNLLLFALAAFLLVRLLHDLFRSPWLAGAAGLLFAVHPVHVESVAWLAGRKDLLSLVFVLLAHRAYRRRRAQPGEGWGVSWGAAALLLLGGLSKGTVWTWAGVLAIDEALEARRGGRPGAGWRLLPCVVVGLGGVALDAWIGAAYGPGAVDHGVSTAALLAAMAGVHWGYVAHVLLPTGLALDYAVDPAGTWSAPATWLGLLLGLAAVVGLLAALRRGRALVALAAGIWILSLAPVNNVWPRTTVLMADRYLVVAAIGLYLAVAALLARTGPARPWILGTAALVLGALCVARTRTFADSARVWDDSLQHAPHSALAWFQRGQAAAADQQWTDALAGADRSLALQPRAEIAIRGHLLRGDALLGLGRLEAVLPEAAAAATAARALIEAGVQVEDARRRWSEAEVQRGLVLERLGDTGAAREAYRHAVDLDGESATAHLDHGTLLATLAQQSENTALATQALGALRRARALAPERLDVGLQYATALASLGHGEDALALFRALEQEHGPDAELLLARARWFLKSGAPERALQDLETLRREHPDHPRAARLVYDLYVDDGQRLLEEARKSSKSEPLVRALERFQHAQRIQPAWREAWIGGGDALFEQGKLLAARDAYRRALATAPDATWIRGLTARAAVLQAAYEARHAEDDVGRGVAARRMAEALGEGTERIDLGLVPLEPELPSLREAAAMLQAGREPAAGWASAVLRAAALLAVGDDGRALDLVAPVVAAQPDEGGAPAILDAALFLRAGMRERAAQLADALSDYALLAQRRPADPVPPLRRLQIEMRAALARRSIAAGYAPSSERVREAHARLWASGAFWSEAPPLAVAEAVARDEAEQVLLEARRLEAADAAVAEVGARVIAFAEAHPEVAEAGLQAVEAEMRRDGWTAALRRLNALGERFPRNPSVLRGQALVYENQFTASQDRTLLEQARIAIQRATLLDPRDPRTALDASTVRRLAGDRRGALALAQRARAYENVPGGPAARVVAALLLAQGHEALDAGGAGAEATAAKAVEAARRVAPDSAGACLLEGRIALERERDLGKALRAAMRAKELEPANLEADRLLSKVHYQTGVQDVLRLAALHDPPHPAEADPKAWRALGAEAQQKAVAQYEAKRRALAPKREEVRTRAVDGLEASLREDPGAEHADKVRQHLTALRRSDPEEQRRRAQEVAPTFTRGLEALEARRYVDASTAFEQVLGLEPNHPRARYYFVVAAYARLEAGLTDEPTRIALVQRAFECLQALDALDPDGRFPLRYLYRGLLHETLFRRSKAEESRQAALKAYKRYLDSQAGLPEPDADNLALARRRLDEMERSGGGR